jgi:hypothetical protein
MEEKRLRELSGLLTEGPIGSLESFIVVRDEPRKDHWDSLDGPDNLWWEVNIKDFRLQVVGAITSSGARGFIQEEWTIYPLNAKNAAIKDATQRFQKTQRGK